MPNISAPRDNNRITTLMAVSSADGVTPVLLYADPTTHRLLTSANSGITIGTTTITSGTSGRILYDNAGVVGEMTTTGSGTVVALATSPVLVTPNLGTPSAVTLTNGTGLPISTGVSGLGTGVATFLATPSSANLASAVTDETGSGLLVFATNPTISGLTMADATDIALNTTTGTKIGTATTQKLAFYNSTPIVKPSGSVITGLTNLGLIATPTIAASEISSGAALTKTDDTNVTLTLGGSPTTALLAAASLTLGWTGTLGVTRGGTGQSTYTDGQLLIGNSSGNTLTKATLTAGTGISITNGNGSISIAATGSSIQTTLQTDFSAQVRLQQSNGGSGVSSPAGSPSGWNASTGTTSGSYSKSLWAPVNDTNTEPIFGQNFSVFASVSTVAFANKTGEFYLGWGALTTAGSGHTFTGKHVGFKITASGTTVSLYGTQADGTTESATAALTTLADNDTLQLLAVNSSGTVSYYYRKNFAAWSGATTNSSNFPSGNVVPDMQVSISNVSTTSNVQVMASVMGIIL